MRNSLIIVFLSCMSLSGKASAVLLQIDLKGIKTVEGNVRISVYDSEATFHKEPARSMSVPVSEQIMTIDIADLVVGEYAVVVFQDLNKNEKLDTNLFGIPREPWGGSSQGKSFSGAPKWHHVKFNLEHDGTAIAIELN